MAEKHFSAAGLRAEYHYDALTGQFSSKRLVALGTYKYRPIGTKTVRGYVVINIFGKTFTAHTLAWLYVNGEWPTNEIDHIDGDKSNNSIANLRSVEHSVNSQNRRTASKNNKSGFLGVHSYRGDRWAAMIAVNGKQTRLGIFDTAEQAHQAYLTAKRKVHEGCTI